MKALQIERVGSLDDLAVRNVSDAPLSDGEVRIEIEAAAVNPSDVAVALGKFPQLTLPRVLGRDFAGRVIEGPAQWQGAAVWGSGGGELGLTRDGAHAERLVLPATALVRRPTSLSAGEAAAAGVPFFTAWSALVDVAHVRAGEWAIVAGASGAVGSASVQLLGALGVHVIALIKDGDDSSRLHELDVAAVARSERDDVAEMARGLTGGKGAGVALNTVGAAVFGPLFEALAKDGRMVVISAAGGRDVTLDLFALYRKRVALLGLDTAAFDLERVARTLEKLNPLFESRALKPPSVGARYPLARAREAYESVGRGSEGKVVLVPD